MRKLLTPILTERTYACLEENELLPTEQKGCKQESYGCIDQLLINKMILENCARSKRNVSSAWIDYKKAFHSVPHSWIIKCLEMFTINLAPLSTCLNNTKQGYEINKRKINHLFYMDLKAYAMNNNQLKNLLDIANTFSDDIKMEFGLDKCAKATFIKGKLTKTSNIILNQTTTIQ